MYREFNGLLHMKVLSGLKLITFDVTNTVFKVYGGVGYQYALIAKKHKLNASQEKLDSSFKEAWGKLNDKFPIYGSRNGMNSEQWWTHIVKETFIGAKCEDEKVADVAKELYSYFKTADPWEIYPGAQETLEYLKKGGFLLGAISNFDERLETILKNLKLQQYFDMVLYSQALSIQKPDPRIFHLALEKAECLPREALHVGDNYENDYLGPTSAGMNALLLVRDTNKIPQSIDKTRVINSISELHVKS